MNDYFELPEVLLAELKAIEEAKDTQRKEGYYNPPTVSDGSGESKERQLSRKRAALAEVATKLRAAQLTALCLSGGGIRSATFNLGVLQALARNGILTQIDYLSTVSGGGYIGSWLSSWIARQGRQSSRPADDVSRYWRRKILLTGAMNRAKCDFSGTTAIISPPALAPSASIAGPSWGPTCATFF